MGSSRRTKCEGGVSEQHRVCRDRHAREVDVVETQRVNPTLAEALCQGVVTSSAGGANPTPSEAFCQGVVALGDREIVSEARVSIRCAE